MHMNDAFKALADPTRREILRLLRGGEKTAGDLARQFDMTKPSMSHHFAVLKQADLIASAPIRSKDAERPSPAPPA